MDVEPCICTINPTCAVVGQWVFITGNGFSQPLSIVCHHRGKGTMAAVVEVYSNKDVAFVVPAEAPESGRCL